MILYIPVIITVDLKEIEYWDVDWIHQAQGSF
jgi:hypothetical protein